MNKKNNNKKSIAFASAFLLSIVGTYNAVVINAHSNISESRFVKRLDETLGVVTAGRHLAAEKMQIQKEVKVSNTITPLATDKTEVIEAAPKFLGAAVQENLEMNLVEVINQTKWKDGLKASQFTGNLVTNNGIIEALNISLPSNTNLFVSFTEMTGNVFEYDYNGELYSGIMYQVDQNSYMVTLTNGPLEGTRLRFSQNATEEQQEEIHRNLAHNHNVEVGSFGKTEEVEEDSGMTSKAETNPSLFVF